MSGTYSTPDALAPYLGYDAAVTLYIGAGSVRMPLAYVATTGVNRRPTARLLQLAEPNATLVIQWAGKRTNAKPAPPQIVTLGSFVLAEAQARCRGVGLDAMGNNILEAAGYVVLYTSDRPENVELPAVWLPWDGRYGTNTQEWTYTPAELGFKQYLPGVPAIPTKINNPPPSSTGAGNKLRI